MSIKNCDGNVAKQSWAMKKTSMCD